MQRPKRPKNLRIGSTWYYYPRDITKIDELAVGSKVEIEGKAEGEGKMQLISVSRYSTSNGWEIFDVLVSDLAKGDTE